MASPQMVADAEVYRSAQRADAMLENGLSRRAASVETRSCGRKGDPAAGVRFEPMKATLVASRRRWRLSGRTRPPCSHLKRERRAIWRKGRSG